MSITDTGAPLSADMQRANRHVLAAQDMLEVLEYLQAYRSIEPLLKAQNPASIEATGRGMLSAAIVAYCRPFLRNDSKGFATDKVDVADLKSVGFRQALHDLLLQKRHKFITHADWTARKAEVLIRGATDIHAAYTEPDVWADLDLKEFMILAQGVQYECLGKTLTHGKAAQDGAPPA